jgi:hypothetical protein
MVFVGRVTIWVKQGIISKIGIKILQTHSSESRGSFYLACSSDYSVSGRATFMFRLGTCSLKHELSGGALHNFLTQV